MSACSSSCAASNSRVAAVVRNDLGELVDQRQGIAQRLGGVTQRATQAVGVDVGDHGGMLVGVGLLDVADQLLTPVGLDVDVDIGHALAFGIEKALEEQPMLESGRRQ